MFKPHVAQVLWGAVVSVSMENEWSSPPFQEGDGKLIHDLIKKVEQGYYAAKESAGRRSTDIQPVLQKTLAINGYEGERKDFFAKVIGTYLSWMYHGTPEKRQKILAIIMSLPPAPHSVFEGVKA